MLIFEHGSLYNSRGECPSVPPAGFDIARAEIRRSGSDVTVINYGGTLPVCMTVAADLAADGVHPGVIDLRSLRPLDMGTVLTSVRKTHRAVIVDEGWRSGSISAEISARITEDAFYDLDAAIARVCSAEVPIPYAKHLEDAALPQPARVTDAIRRAMGDG